MIGKQHFRLCTIFSSILTVFDSVKSETNLRYNLGKYPGLKVASNLSIKKYTYSLLKNSIFCWEWMHWRGTGANYNWTDQCNIFLLLMNHDNKLLQNDNVNSQYFIPKKNYRRSGEFSSYLLPCERGAINSFVRIVVRRERGRRFSNDRWDKKLSEYRTRKNDSKWKLLVPDARFFSNSQTESRNLENEKILSFSL